MEESRKSPQWGAWRPVFTGLVWVAGLVVLCLVLKYVIPYFTPFVLAVALAILIDPTVDALEERLNLPRGWAVLLALLFFFGLALGLVLFGVGAVVVQLGLLAQDLPTHYERLVEFSEEILAAVTTVFRGLPADFLTVAERTLGSVLQSVYSGLEALLLAVLSGLKGLPAAILVGVVTVVAAFFVSRDKTAILRLGLSLLPATWRERVERVNSDVVASVVGLIKAQLILVAITLVLTVTGLLLLGVRYAWIVGVVAGLLDVLPAVGPAAVLLPWAAYCFIDGNAGLGAGLVVLVTVTAVVRQVLEPRIVGQRIGLHPLVTLLALYLGVRLLGPGGLVVGPLVAIVIKAVVRTGTGGAGAMASSRGKPA